MRRAQRRRPPNHADARPPCADATGRSQVTNPPIDPLREGIVMGLDMSLGKRRDLQLAPSEELADQLRVSTPLLNTAEVRHPEAAATRPRRRRAAVART